MILCPLCSVALPDASELEAHIREELDYARWRCRYCVVSFFSYSQATTHFDPVVRSHPGKAPSIAESVHIHLEKRVQELLGQAQSGDLKPKPFTLFQPPLVLSTPLRDGEEGASGEQTAGSEERMSAESPPTNPPEALLRQKMDLEEEEEEEEPEMISLNSIDSVKSRSVDRKEEEELIAPSSDSSLTRPTNAARQPPVSMMAGGSSEALSSAGETSRPKEEKRDMMPTGPVACRLCGKVVAAAKEHRRRALIDHVATHHIKGFQYKCHLCDEGFRCMRPVTPKKKSHFRNAHPGQPLSFRDLRGELKAEVESVLAEAFPAINYLRKRAVQLDPQDVRCAKCQLFLRKTKHSTYGKMRHVYNLHCSEPVYKCLSCDFGSKRSEEMRLHIGMAHSDAPKDSFTDRRPQLNLKLAPILAECFP